MYINTFKYKPEDVSCVLCTEYVKKLGCTALSCPCLAERMEAGTVGYAEAVAELFRPYCDTVDADKNGNVIQRN